MSYKSIKSCGVKYIGRVETVLRDSFTENSVGKEIVIEGKVYKVRGIYTDVHSTPENMIRLNIMTERLGNYIKNK